MKLIHLALLVLVGFTSTACLAPANLAPPEPTLIVESGEIAVAEGTSSISREEIKKVVSAATPALQECFRRELANTSAALGGTVTVSFLIGLDGSVLKTSIRESTMNRLSLELCAMYVISRTHFSKPQNEVEIVFPFVFRQQK